MEAYFIIGFIALIPLVLLGFPLIVQKMKKDILFRNDLLAFAYMIKDLGPNVAAFSVVSIFTSQAEANKVLVTVAFVGIALHYSGRKIRDYIYKISNKDSRWKNLVESMKRKQDDT